MDYLVVEYTGERQSKLTRINEDDLFELIQEQGELGRDERKKIVIFKLNKPLIDWS